MNTQFKNTIVNYFPAKTIRGRKIEPSQVIKVSNKNEDGSYSNKDIKIVVSNKIEAMGENFFKMNEAKTYGYAYMDLEGFFSCSKFKDKVYLSFVVTNFNLTSKEDLDKAFNVDLKKPSKDPTIEDMKSYILTHTKLTKEAVEKLGEGKLLRDYYIDVVDGKLPF